MNTPLRVLVIEGSEQEANSWVETLRKSGYEFGWTRVETAQGLAEALDGRTWDLILSNGELPHLSALTALQMVQARSLDVPLLVISSAAGEPLAAECMRAGARDYFIEGNLVRLGEVIRREFTEVINRRLQRRTDAALRKSQEHLGRAQAIAHLGSWETDLLTDKLECSEEVYRIFGTTPQNFGSSHEGFLGAVHPAERETVRQTIAEAIRERKQFTVEHRIVRPNGEERMIHAEGQILCDSAGRPTRIVGAVQDITPQRILEEQFRQAQKMEAVGRLAGGVAHDFNNLLTIISGYAQLLMGHLNAQDIRRSYVEEINKAANRATALTRQLLAFSRQQVLMPQMLDLNAVVASTESMLHRLIGEDIELRTNLSADLWAVKADRGQIEQVIMNLVVNARDAMPQGGTISLETKNVTLARGSVPTRIQVTPGSYVMLAVSDTGVGMTEEVRAHIFEPFFTTKEKGKGTGLGLAMVYGFVKQSGGYIWAYSELGHGSVFKVYLPMAEGASRRAEVATQANTAALRGTETILVVEDEASVRSFVRSVLESNGYTVLDADGPQQASEVLKNGQHVVHLLLTDVVMPKMSGPALANSLLSAYPGLKVLFMSGYTDDAIVHHGILDSNMAFLQKPFTPENLARKVRETLGKPGLKSQ